MRISINDIEYNNPEPEQLINIIRQQLVDNIAARQTIVVTLYDTPDNALLERLLALLGSEQGAALVPRMHDEALEAHAWLVSLQCFAAMQRNNQQSENGQIQSRQPAIRKSKINLVSGQRVSRSVSIQHQQQQQQQQQQQIASAAPKRRRQKAARPPGLENALLSVATADHLGPLIDRSNIYPLLRNPDNPKDLGLIWENLTGTELAGCSDVQRTITQVQRQAMEIIIAHDSFFKDGIFPENLPAGFYLQRVDSPPMHVLCYNDSLKEQQQTGNPLRVSLDTPPIQLSPSAGYHLVATLAQYNNPAIDNASVLALLKGERSALQRHCPDYINRLNQFKTLTRPTSTRKKQLEAMRDLICVLTSHNMPAQVFMLEALDTLSANQVVIKGLALVLAQEGLSVFEQLSALLAKIQHQGSLTVFCEAFLKNEQSILALSNEQGFDHLEQLSTLDDAQKNWWEDLLNQHQQAGSPLDFNRLFAAWRFFLQELAKLGIKNLPQACPIKGIKSMQLALDRVLYIIKKADNPEEQLRCLTNLDFSSSGAWQAVCFDHYELVSAAMHPSFNLPQSDLVNRQTTNQIFPDEIEVSCSESGHGPDFRDWRVAVTEKDPWIQGDGLGEIALNVALKFIEDIIDHNEVITVRKIDINSPEGDIYERIQSRINPLELATDGVEAYLNDPCEKNYDAFKDILDTCEFSRYHLILKPLRDLLDNPLKEFARKRAKHFAKYGIHSNDYHVRALLNTPLAQAVKDEIEWLRSEYKLLSKAIYSLETQNNHRYFILAHYDKSGIFTKVFHQDLNDLSAGYFSTLIIKAPDNIPAPKLLINDDGSLKAPTRRELIPLLNSTETLGDAMQWYYRFLGTHSQHPLQISEAIAALISQRNDFNDDDKKELGGIAALLSTGDWEDGDVIAEFNKFLTTLANLDHDVFKTFVHLSILTPEQTPTIEQCTRCLNLVTNDHQVLLLSPLIALFIESCSLMPNPAALLPAVFNAFDERKKAFDAGIMNCASLNPLRFFTALEATILSNQQSDEQLTSAWIKFMPLINSVWDMDHIAQASALRFRLGQLTPDELGLELLNLLGELNIEQCAQLPTLTELASIITFIEGSAQIPTEKDARQAFLKQQITRLLPNLTIGQEPVNPIIRDLVSIVRGVVQDFNIEQMFAELEDADETPIPQLRLIFRTEINQVKTLLAQLKVDHVDIDKLFKAISKLEKSIFAELKGVKLFPFRPLISQAWEQFRSTPEVVTRLPNLACKSYDEFLESASFSLLIKDPLEFIYKGMLDTNIQKLQLQQHNVLMTYLDNQRPIMTLEKGRSIKEQLDTFSASFEQINNLVKALLQTKNKNGLAYRQLLPLLNAGNTLQLLTINEFTEVLTAFNLQPMSTTTQLALVLECVASMDNISPQRRGIALQQVAVLSSYQRDLDEETCLSLMRASLRHTLTQDSPFPVDAMLAVRCMQTISEEARQALFQSLTRLVKITPAESSAYLSSLIPAIANALTHQPKLQTWVMSLLSQYQQGSLEEIDQLRELISVIPAENPQQADWLDIMLKCKTDSLAEKIALKNRLAAHPNQLGLIASLFRFRPYPPQDTLVNKLDEGSEALVDYIARFDSFPTAKYLEVNGTRVLDRRDANRLKKQFTNSHIARVISEVAELHGARLSRDNQFELAQELTYLNTIARNVALDAGNVHIADLTKASRVQLQAGFQALVERLRQPEPDEKTRRRDQLHLLAIMREMYFRTTGDVPYTTQMLTLLMLLRTSSNQLFQIDTGEGKGITTAMMAVLLWAQGGTVDVLTANRALIVQDYQGKGSDVFFEALGIPSTTVYANSPAYTRCIGGINYTTLSELSIYRQRAKLDGEPLNDEQNGIARPIHMIADESDHAILDSRILFNFSVNATQSDVNPYAWIYPLINTFIDQAPFRNINTATGNVWSSLVDIQQLKRYLGEEATTDAQRNQLIDLSNHQYNRWVDAAVEAALLVEGADFIVQREENETRDHWNCVPLIENNPQPGNSFSGGVQQFIQARQQAKEPNRHYPIETELSFVSSESAKTVLDDYLQSGRIVGLSGTPAGILEERLEQQANLDFQAFRIPPHRKTLRAHHGTHVAASNSAHLRRIEQELVKNRREQGAQCQPTLIVCKDINEARALYEKLQASGRLQGLNLELVTGEESDKTLQRKIRQAGESNRLTITTSLLGRGTDIKPKHGHGLWVIKTYLDTERVTTQVIGRAARNGHLGRYSLIYNNQGLPQYHDLKNLHRLSGEAQEKALRELRRRINQEHAVERYYTQQAASINQLITQQFDAWQGLFEHVCENYASHLKPWLLKQREVLIGELAKRWAQRLEESDPKRNFPNPFVRRDKKNRLQTAALDEALRLFEQDVLDVWSDLTTTELLVKAQQSDMSAINQLRTQRLAAVDMSDALATRNQRLRKEKQDLTQSITHDYRSLSQALVPEAALLAIGDIRTQGEKDRLSKRSTEKQLRIFMNQFNQLIARSQLTKKQKIQLMITSIESLQAPELLNLMAQRCLDYQVLVSNNLQEKFKLQPLLKGVFDLVESVKDYHEQDRGLQEKLATLQKSVMDDVIEQLVANLERQLSWASPANAGWQYAIERQSVRKSARALWEAIQTLREATPEEKAERMQALYAQLLEHQMRIGSVWSLSLGHRDTRKVMTDALRLIDSTAIIDKLAPGFRLEAQEQAIRRIYWEKLENTLHHLPTEQNPALQSIITNLRHIGEQDTSVYAFATGLSYLNQQKKITMQQNPRSPLLRPLQTMIGKLAGLLQTMQTDHLQLWKKSRFIQLKQTQLKTTLNNLEGVNIDKLSLTTGHTGFNLYYELTLQGRMTNPDILNHFVRYPGKTHENLSLLRENTVQEALASNLQAKNDALQDYIKNQIPPLLRGHGDSLTIHDCLEAELEVMILPVNQLINFLKSTAPLLEQDALAMLVPETTELMIQYQIISELNYQTIDNLSPALMDKTLEELKQKKQALKAHNDKLMTTLGNLLAQQAARLDDLEKPGFSLVKYYKEAHATYLSNEVASVRNTMRDNEKTEQVLSLQIKNHIPALLRKLDLQAGELTRANLNTRLKTLQSGMEHQLEDQSAALRLHTKKIAKLDKALQKEEQKTTLMSKRFSNLDELRSFESLLLSNAEWQKPQAGEVDNPSPPTIPFN